MNFKKIAVIFSVVLVTCLMIYGYMMYRDIFAPNTSFAEKEQYVFIATDANYEQVKTVISPFIKDMDRFEMVANKKSYPAKENKSGRFLLKKDMSSNDIINALRQNVPVNLAFNNQERLEDFFDTSNSYP